VRNFGQGITRRWALEGTVSPGGGFTAADAGRIFQKGGVGVRRVGVEIDPPASDGGQLRVGLYAECLAAFEGEPVNLLIVFPADLMADQVQQVAQAQGRARLIDGQATGSLRTRDSPQWALKIMVLTQGMAHGGSVAQVCAPSVGHVISRQRAQRVSSVLRVKHIVISYLAP